MLKTLAARPVRAAPLGVLLGALLSGCGLLPDDADEAARRAVTFAVAEREPAPVVDAATLAGEPLALADLDGPVVVNFWASWCGPCIQAAPHLNAVAEAYSDRACAWSG